MAPLFPGWLGRRRAVRVPGGQEEGTGGPKSRSKQIYDLFSSSKKNRKNMR